MRRYPRFVAGDKVRIKKIPAAATEGDEGLIVGDPCALIDGGPLVWSVKIYRTGAVWMLLPDCFASSIL